jgi:hypothetical protein
MVMANFKSAQNPAQIQQEKGFVLLVVTQETVTSGPDGWQLSVSQSRWLVPAEEVRKQVPKKT